MTDQQDERRTVSTGMKRAGETTEARPLTELTAFQRDLLVCIRDTDKVNGQTIMGGLRDHYRELNESRCYHNLDRLVEAGYVYKGFLDGRTNSYEITDRGRRELAAHLRWLEKRHDGTHS